MKLDSAGNGYPKKHIFLFKKDLHEKTKKFVEERVNFSNLDIVKDYEKEIY